MSRPLPTLEQLRHDLGALGLDRLARAGLRRDPGLYNLLVHIVPPEVARDHAAGDLVADRLAQPPGPLCLYVHIAPCTGRCTFCHYAIEVNPSQDQTERYLRALEKEITARWSSLDDRSPVRSLMIGGGTPTYLTAAQLDKLFKHIHATVRLDHGIELTIEGSPETITRDKLQVLKDHGGSLLHTIAQPLGNLGLFPCRDARIFARIQDWVAGAACAQRHGAVLNPNQRALALLLSRAVIGIQQCIAVSGADIVAT